MNRILSAVAAYLHSIQHRYELDSSQETLCAGLCAENGRWRYMAYMDDSGRFVMVSLIPLKSPPGRRGVCADLLTRINGALGLGHFDLDFSDGKLEFRTVVPVARKGPVSREVIEDVIAGHSAIVDRFLPVLASVLFAGVDPRKALALTDDSGAVAEPRRFSLN